MDETSGAHQIDHPGAEPGGIGHGPRASGHLPQKLQRGDESGSIPMLRGPQGKLFERNTIGGASSLTPLDPADTFGVRARARRFGERNR